MPSLDISSRKRRWGFLAASEALFFISLASGASAQTAHLTSGTQNFGSVNVGTASAPATLTFTFDTAGTLGSIAVVTQGATGLDFADAGTGSCAGGHSYSAGATCTVTVILTPKYAGTRFGATLLNTSAGAPFATAYLQGSGVGPQVNFSPGRESTIGSGIGHPNGITVDASGNVFVADWDNGRVVKETWSAGSYTQSTVASGLDFVAGLAMDGAGNLYIADYGKNQVLKETLSAGSYTESVVASGLYDPNGVAVDALGNVYIADALNGRVLKETLSESGYTQTDILDCGSVGTQSCPSSVAVDESGNLFITAYTSGQVLELKPAASGYTQKSIGSGFNWPSGITTDNFGNVYIADTFNNQIVEERLSAGSYTQSVVPSSSLYWPWGVAVDGNGNVYINDSYNSRVLKEDLWDTTALRFVPTPEGATSEDSPKTITLTNIGNAALSFPVPGSGNNPRITGSFTLSSSGALDCPLISAGSSVAGKLDAGASCQLPVSFSPTSATPNYGSLIVTDNNLNAASPSFAEQNITLLGSIGKAATQTTISVSAPYMENSLYWKPLELSGAVTLTVTVSGAAGVTPGGTVTIGDAPGNNNGNSAAFPSLTLTLNPEGVATWTSSTLPITGNFIYTLSASYSGDSNYKSGSSNYIDFALLGPPESVQINPGTVILGQWYSGLVIYGNQIELYLLVEDSAGNEYEVDTFNCSGTGVSFPNGATTFTSGVAGVLFPLPLTTGTNQLTCSGTTFGTTVTGSTTFVSNPAPLSVTVTPSLTYETYGKVMFPYLTSSVSGLLNGDTLGGTVTVSAASTATAESGVGVYPVAVTLGGSSAPNYAVTAVGGAIRVLPAPLTIVAKDEGVVYGQTPGPLSYWLHGFVNGEDSSVVTGSPVLTTTVTSTTPHGRYPIDVQVGTLAAANYEISTIGPQGDTGFVGVTKAPLTVTANTVKMTEGGTVPALTYTITGFVNGEDTSVVSGMATLSTTVNAGTRAGEYPITVNVSGLSAENYYFIPAVHGGVVEVGK